MNSKLKNEQLDELYEAILSLGTIDECYNFFEDLCTVSEIKAMCQRFHVAGMLKRGCQYNEIVKETGASTSTISRVNRSLFYGNDGYTTILERLANK
jgi:TrpR-related protein YerC/YecD